MNSLIPVAGIMAMARVFPVTVGRYDMNVILEIVMGIAVTVGAILLVCISKARHFDYLTIFRFNGKILDSDSGKAIEGAEIFFLDKGLDLQRSKKPQQFKLLVGKSDNNGTVDLILEYFWGFTSTRFKRKPSKDFEILIIKDSYEIGIKKFNLEQLKEIDTKFVIDFGTVKLSRSIKSRTQKP